MKHLTKFVMTVAICAVGTVTVSAQTASVKATAAQTKATSMQVVTAQNDEPRIIKTEKPKMTVFLPAKGLATGRAVVAYPGGGYHFHAKGYEGFEWAPFFNNLGIAYAVVEYSFPNGDKTLPYSDATAAIKIMRDSADVWHINTNDIGAMGSSAGGHLASTVATHADSLARPNFQILFYPVISMDKQITHKGSRKNFLGANPDEADVLEYSNELKVTKDTPRAIMLLSDDDKTVAPDNSIRYYNALHAAGVPASIIIYPTGAHGWGHKSTFEYHEAMLAQLTAWLKGF